MSAPLPPPQAVTPTALGQTAAAAPLPQQKLLEVMIEQLPPRIAQLARTIILTGAIIEQTPQGQATIRTQVGNIVIRSTQPLPQAPFITLQLPAGAPPTTAFIGILPPPNMLAATAAAAAPTNTPPAAAPVIMQPQQALPPSSAPMAEPVSLQALPLASLQTLEHMPLLEGTILTAQVQTLPQGLGVKKTVSPLASPPQNPPLAGSLSPAPLLSTPAWQPHLMAALDTPHLAQFLATISPDILVPPPAPLPQAGAVRTPPASSIATPAHEDVPHSTLARWLQLPAGSQITLRVDNVIPPPLATNPPAPPPQLAPPSPQSLTAVVVGQLAPTQAIATSPAGLLVVETATPLAPQTTLELSLIHIEEPALSTDSARGQAPANGLQSLLAAHTAPPPLAQLNRVKPESLGGIIALLLVGFKFKAPEILLGKATLAALPVEQQQEAKAMMQALLTDNILSPKPNITTPSAAPPEAITPEWKGINIPLPPQTGLQQLAVYWRDEESQNSASHSKILGKHLLIELEFTRLGAMVLDGFIHQQRFDLALKTQRTLPLALKQQIHTAWDHSLAGLGWAGQLRFHTAAEIWLQKA